MDRLLAEGHSDSGELLMFLLINLLKSVEPAEVVIDPLSLIRPDLILMPEALNFSRKASTSLDALVNPDLFLARRKQRERHKTLDMQVNLTLP